MTFVLANFKLLQMKEDHGLVHVAIWKRERKDKATVELCGTRLSSWLSAKKCQEEAKPSCQAVPEKRFCLLGFWVCREKGAIP